MGQFAQTAVKGFGDAAEGTKPLDKNILSNRESARLLTEELGIHMPRAVTSAISELMPAIGGMGTALLGVFAIKEAMEFGGYLHKMVDDFNEVARAEKTMKQIGEENLSNMEKMAKESTAYARQQIGLLALQIADEEKQVNDMMTEQEIRIQHGGMLAAKVYGELTGATKKLNKAEDDLAATVKLRNAVMTILGEGEVKTREKATAAAEKQSAAEAKLLKDMPAEAANFADIKYHIDGVTKAQNDSITSLALWEVWQQKEAYQILPLYRRELEGLAPVFQQNIKLTDQHTFAMDKFGQAMKSDVVAQIDQATIGLVGLVAGRRAQAAVEVIWETARGVACLAEGAWPPNPAAIAAAALHFEAAAQYGIMAGTGGGSRSGGAGSGGGSSDRYGAGGGGGSSTTGGGAAGPGSHGPTIIWHQIGPMVGTMQDLARTLTSVTNQLAQSGQLKVVATTALTNGPKVT
jgi:uncharacterized membrane protein YgcG